MVGLQERDKRPENQQKAAKAGLISKENVAQTAHASVPVDHQYQQRQTTRLTVGDGKGLQTNHRDVKILLKMKGIRMGCIMLKRALMSII